MADPPRQTKKFGTYIPLSRAYCLTDAWDQPRSRSRSGNFQPPPRPYPLGRLDKRGNPQTSSRLTFLPPSPQHSAAARLTADPPLAVDPGPNRLTADLLLAVDPGPNRLTADPLLAVDPGPNRLRCLYAYTSTFRLV
jgi:hypothetical protein